MIMSLQSADLYFWYCNTSIPRIRERYGDVHMQGEHTLTYVR